MEIITASTLRERQQQGDSMTLIDVREPYESEEGNLGGENIPLADLMRRVDDIRAWCAQGDVVVYCRTGSRSQMAHKILTVQGKLPNILMLEGGYEAWLASAG